MNSYTFIYHPNSENRDYSVHRTGCADIKLKQRRAVSSWTREAPDVDTAIREQIKDEFDGSGGDFDFTRDDYHVAPCVK